MTPYRTRYLAKQLCKREYHCVGGLISQLLLGEIDALKFEAEIRDHMKDEDRILSPLDKKFIQREEFLRQQETNPYYDLTADQEHA